MIILKLAPWKVILSWRSLQQCYIFTFLQELPLYRQHVSISLFKVRASPTLLTFPAISGHHPKSSSLSTYDRTRECHSDSTLRVEDETARDQEKRLPKKKGSLIRKDRHCSASNWEQEQEHLRALRVTNIDNLSLSRFFPNEHA